MTYADGSSSATWIAHGFEKLSIEGRTALLFELAPFIDAHADAYEIDAFTDALTLPASVEAALQQLRSRATPQRRLFGRREQKTYMNVGIQAEDEVGLAAFWTFLSYAIHGEVSSLSAPLLTVDDGADAVVLADDMKQVIPADLLRKLGLRRSDGSK